MIDLTDTSGTVGTDIEPTRETMAAATPRAALRPEQAAPAGYVDKVERLPRSFAIERKRQLRAPQRSTFPAGPTEEQIHRSVVEWLERRGVAGLLFYHVPNGEVRHKGAAGKLKAMGTRSGVADLVLHHDGHTYFLEIKAPGGRQSPEQREFERRAELAGMTYAVAHGLDYALDTLRNWGLLE